MAHDFDTDPLVSYGYQVRATHRAFDRVLQQHLARHKLGNGFWYVLRVLWEQEGLTQRELARAVNLTDSSVVLVLKGMQSAKLVTRRRDQQDRRRMRTYLTPRGRILKDKLLPYAGAINAAAARGIPARDRRVMLRVLTEMRSNLEAIAQRPGRSSKPTP